MTPRACCWVLDTPTSLKSKACIQPCSAAHTPLRPSPSQGRHTLPAGHNAILDAQNTLGLTPRTVSCALYRSSHMFMSRFGRRPLPCVMHCVKIAFLLGWPPWRPDSRRPPKPTPPIRQPSHSAGLRRSALRGEAHENLRVLCKDIGHRLSGSPAPTVPWRGDNNGWTAMGWTPATSCPWRCPHGPVATWPRHKPSRQRHRHGPPHHGAPGSVPTPDDGWIEGPLLVVRHGPWIPWTPRTSCSSTGPWTPCINTGAAYGGRSTNALRAPAPPKPAQSGCWSL